MVTITLAEASSKLITHQQEQFYSPVLMNVYIYIADIFKKSIRMVLHKLQLLILPAYITSYDPTLGVRDTLTVCYF